jgi:hypothetical protein
MLPVVRKRELFGGLFDRRRRAGAGVAHDILLIVVRPTSCDASSGA